MKLQEAWHLSKVPYIEVVFRSALLNRPASQGGLAYSRSTPEARIRQILRSVYISKIIFTIFIGIGAAFPFFEVWHGPSDAVASVSLSLLISLGYLILYLFQVLPSFASTEPYSLLSTLPFNQRDFSLVTFLSFLRTFDWQALCSIIVQVTAVALLTHSILASSVMFFASCANITFGITIGVFLSRVFYQNMNRGGRSIVASLSRAVFLLTWGIASMSIIILARAFSSTTYISGALSAELSAHPGLLVSILAVVHPFSVGIIIAAIVFPSSFATRNETLIGILALAATFCYFGLALFAGNKTSQVVSSIARGQGVKIERRVAKEFILKVHKPIFAYLIKDLRAASKTPQTAFLFAFPVIETAIIFFSEQSTARFSATTLVSSMSIGLFFVLFLSSALLNTEASSLDLTVSLPIETSTIVNAKAFLVGLIYSPVPIMLAILAINRTLTSPLLLLIPFIEILAVAAAGAAQITLFVVGHRKVVVGSGLDARTKTIAFFQPTGFSLLGGRDIGRLALSICLGAGLLAAPLLAYAAAWFVSYSHLYSILLMAIAALVEFVAVEVFVRR